MAQKIMSVFLSVAETSSDDILSWNATTRMERNRVFNAVNGWVFLVYCLPYPLPECTISLFEKFYRSLPAGVTTLKHLFELFKGTKKRKDSIKSVFVFFLFGRIAGCINRTRKMHIVV